MNPSLRVDPERLKTLELAIQDLQYEIHDARSSSAGSRLVHRAMRPFRSFYVTGIPRWRLSLRSLDPRERMVPAFASVGAVRSGTSSLAQYILQHPCVVLPLSKEPALEDSRMLAAHMPRRDQALEVRRRYGMAVTGYFTPMLPSLRFAYAAKLVNPDTKILLCVRNPIDRAFSHWKHDVALIGDGSNDLVRKTIDDFARIVDEEIESIQLGGQGYESFSGVGFGYLQVGIYLPFIKVLHRVFPANQIKVVFAEDMFKDGPAVARDAYRFLGLPDVVPVEVRERNPGSSAVLDASVRKRLAAFYAPYNQRFFEFLGREMRW